VDGLGLGSSGGNVDGVQRPAAPSRSASSPRGRAASRRRHAALGAPGPPGAAADDPVGVPLHLVVGCEPRRVAVSKPSPTSTPLMAWMPMSAPASRASRRRSQCTCEPRPGGSPVRNDLDHPPRVSPSFCAASTSATIAAEPAASKVRTGSASSAATSSGGQRCASATADAVPMAIVWTPGGCRMPAPTAARPPHRARPAPRSRGPRPARGSAGRRRSRTSACRRDRRGRAGAG
jgi:hypothetical protein